MAAEIKSLLLLVAACSAISTASQATAAKPAPSARASAEVPQEVIDALEALQGLEHNRLLSDKAYAEKALRNVAIVEPFSKNLPTVMLALNTTKALALVGLDRLEEADALSRRSLATNPDQIMAYGGRLAILLVHENASDVLDLIEGAERNVKSEDDRKEFANLFDQTSMGWLQRTFRAQGDDASRYRAADALLRLGWDADGDVGTVDRNRMLALEGRVKRGDTAGAKALAEAIDTPPTVLDLITIRKYDPLIDAKLDRNVRFQNALDREDARTGRDLARKPNDSDVLLRRIQHLASLGQDQEIVALTDTLATDMARVEQKGEPAFWALNERAYALVHLSRGDEAVALMEKLLALDYKKHPELISMGINHAIILNQTGRHAAALTHAQKLIQSAGQYASSYGQRWMWSSAACALAMQGKGAEAEPWLAKLRKKSDENYAALTRALLCTEKMDEAEKVLLDRLGGDDPSDIITSLQNYRDPGAHASAFERTLAQRRLALAGRPAVKAAIDKVGRVLTLPIVQSYWGSY